MKVTFFSFAEWSTCCCCVAFCATRAVQTDTVTASSDVWYVLDNSFIPPLQCGLLLVWAACSLQRRLPHHIAPWWVGLCWHGNDEESCGPCNTHVAQTSPGVCTSLFRVHVCVCVCGKDHIGWTVQMAVPCVSGFSQQRGSIFALVFLLAAVLCTPVLHADIRLSRY